MRRAKKNQKKLFFNFTSKKKKASDRFPNVIKLKSQGELVKTIGQCSIPITLKCTKHKSDVISGQLREIVEAEMVNLTPQNSMGSTISYSGPPNTPKYVNQVPQPADTFIPLSSSTQIPHHQFHSFTRFV